MSNIVTEEEKARLLKEMEAVSDEEWVARGGSLVGGEVTGDDQTAHIRRCEKNNWNVVWWIIGFIIIMLIAMQLGDRKVERQGAIDRAAYQEGYRRAVEDMED